ncbi:tRNA (cytidine(34)-2'-O)-methyltransferase [bacterium HR40]|nr:tRNA (cytidine(34)-2'-O)-methyltransferase [bacterium HR40]
MDDAILALALFEPELAPNFGAMLRLAACFGVPVEVIEPTGFPLDDRRIRRAGMDYVPLSRWRRHLDFAAFEAWRRAHARRLVLLSTAGERPYHRFAFQPRDVLLLGRESSGVPEAVRAAADVALRIPIRLETRSLNVVTAAAIVLGEAARQLGMLDELDRHCRDRCHGRSPKDTGSGMVRGPA